MARRKLSPNPSALSAALESLGSEIERGLLANDERLRETARSLGWDGQGNYLLTLMDTFSHEYGWTMEDFASLTDFQILGFAEEILRRRSDDHEARVGDLFQFVRVETLLQAGGNDGLRDKNRAWNRVVASVHTPSIVLFLREKWGSSLDERGRQLLIGWLQGDGCVDEARVPQLSLAEVAVHIRRFSTKRSGSDAEEHSGQADRKTDTSRKKDSIPRNAGRLIRLAKKIKKALEKPGVRKTDVAREFNDFDEEKAQKDLRALRRHPRLLE
jgi:hypothetical protein